MRSRRGDEGQEVESKKQVRAGNRRRGQEGGEEGEEKREEGKEGERKERKRTSSASRLYWSIEIANSDLAGAFARRFMATIDNTALRTRDRSL